MDIDQFENNPKSSKRQSKSKIKESYDDDFEDDSSSHKKNNDIDLPKIHKNKPKNDSRTYAKPIQEQSEDDPYADDFEHSQNKKVSPVQQKKHPKNDYQPEKPSPHLNKKTSKTHQNQDDYEEHQKKPRNTQHKQFQNQQKNTSKPSTPNSLKKHKKSSSSIHFKQTTPQPELLTKKSSQSVMKNSSLHIQSKYLNYLKTQFPHSREEVLLLPTQKVNRLNDKLRGYIKRVNDELTDLINENMRVIKAGVNNSKDSSKKSADDLVKMLTEQKKNGETYIETVQKQCANMAEQWQKMKNHDVEGNAEQQIRQISQKIKEYTKEIGTLKYDMKMEGNKLTQENNYIEKIAQLKSKISIMKRQEEKYAQKLEKCNKNAEQLGSKGPQIDAQLQKLLDQAKKQNIVILFNQADKKRRQKHEELKKKIENIRSHQSKTQGLCQTKTSLLKKQIQSINSQISTINQKFVELQRTLHSTQESSVILIEESKQKELEPYIQTHLDFIYKNIKEGNPLSSIPLPKLSNSRQKGGLKKYASSANVKGFVRSDSNAELKPSFHITKKNPLEIKVKDKGTLKLGDKTDSSPLQRVWKDEVKDNPSHESRKEPEEPNSSKPFVVKKSQHGPPVQTEAPKKVVQPPAKQSQEKENENKSTSILGPKKLFKKVENIEAKHSNEKSKEVPVITEKNANEPVQKNNDEEDNSKPQFKIKKARKSIVEIPDEDLYLFPPGSDKSIKREAESKQKPKISPKNSPKNNPIIELPKDPTLSLNVKGPNFKLSNSKENHQKGAEFKLSLEYNERTSAINLQVGDLKSHDEPKNLPSVEEEGVNIGGRRQVQRKIQRKNQEGYVV